MTAARQTRKLHPILLTMLIAFLLFASGAIKGDRQAAQGADVVASYLVQAADMDTAVAAVTQTGAEITHELAIVNAVGADLTEAQAECPAGRRFLCSRRANYAGRPPQEDTYYPTLIGADLLHAEGHHRGRGDRRRH
jgi:hypothetical protein